MARPLPHIELPLLQPERESIPETRVLPRAWSPYEVWRERVLAPQEKERKSGPESSYKPGRGNP